MIMLFAYLCIHFDEKPVNRSKTVIKVITLQK